jgi:hypothetical protein
MGHKTYPNAGGKNRIATTSRTDEIPNQRAQRDTTLPSGNRMMSATVGTVRSRG